LPPYSPDFNPIEEAFVELKAWYKKNTQMARDYRENFDEFLEFGLRSLVGKPGNHFHSAHIYM